MLYLYMAKKVYVQIGTNDGNDLFRSKVLKDRPDLVILVEPNAALKPLIEKNYKGIPNVHIYNKAVHYTNDATVELYIPAKNAVYGTTADNNITYSHQHFSLFPMNNWGSKNDMVKISAQTVTFDELCRLHTISQIHYLQIDTEGFDSEIIKMIDFTKYQIQQLRFEIWNFEAASFTQHHTTEVASTLGINGLHAAIQKLQQHKYTLTKIHDRDGNDVLATLTPTGSRAS